MNNDEQPPYIAEQLPFDQGETPPVPDNVRGIENVGIEPEADKPRNRRFHPGGAGLGSETPKGTTYDPEVLRKKLEEATERDREPTVREDLGYVGLPQKPEAPTPETPPVPPKPTRTRPVGIERNPIVPQPPVERADPKFVKGVAEATRRILRSKPEQEPEDDTKD
ncbi:MAG: hypothetical protein WCO19_01030 [Candidatus Saccharibacteria bacterium]